MMPSASSSPSVVPLLVGGMLLTGICNSLFTKLQDMQCVENCSNWDPEKRIEFVQPVWQTVQMFVGECLCLLPIAVRSVRARLGAKAAYKITREANAIQSQLLIADSENETVDRGSWTRDRSQGEHAIEVATMTLRSAFLFFAPAVCDICGTTLMNVGLLFTPVSIYQMTRGALVLWVGVFSVIFLRRHLHHFQWLSLVTVMLGVSIVGLSGTILKKADSASKQSFSAAAMLLAASPSAKAMNLSLSTQITAVNPGRIFLKMLGKSDEELPEAVIALLGVLLILFAQLFTAGQFVLEEKIMSHHHVDPLLAVGCEGIFGLCTMLIAMPLLHIFYGSTAAGAGGYFDMRTGWEQMVSTPAILWSSVAIAISIALFNGCGLSVTQAISATARSTIDTCRTLGIWVVSLLLGWEVLGPVSGTLQTLGFACLVYGTLVFNGIVRPPKPLQAQPRAGGRNSSRNRSRSRSRGRHRSRTRSTPRATAGTATDTVETNGFSQSDIRNTDRPTSSEDFEAGQQERRHNRRSTLSDSW